MPSPRKGKFTVVRCVAVADIERLKLGEGFLTRDARALRPAIDGPIVKDGEVAVRRRVDVKLHNRRACFERGAHRCQRVLQIAVRGRADARCGAGVVFKSFG